MDKVDFASSSLLNAPLHAKPGAKKTGTREKAGLFRARGKGFFSEILQNSVREAGELGPLRELEPSEEALAELMDAVHSAGSDLKDRPFPDEILRYKKAVRDFMNYVVENGYEIVKVLGIKRKAPIQGKMEWVNSAYRQIQVIDRKLEELAASILSGQATQLIRISKLDEIKGLLVDLSITGAIRERDD